MPGPKRSNPANRQNRVDLSEEFASKMADAMHLAGELENILDTLEDGQGRHWKDLRQQVEALLERSRRLAI